MRLLLFLECSAAEPDVQPDTWLLQYRLWISWLLHSSFRLAKDVICDRRTILGRGLQQCLRGPLWVLNAPSRSYLWAAFRFISGVSTK